MQRPLEVEERASLGRVVETAPDQHLGRDPRDAERRREALDDIARAGRKAEHRRRVETATDAALPQTPTDDRGTPSPSTTTRGTIVLKEFRAFLLRGNLLELAVAFVIGAAFVTLIKALVEDLITPILAAIGGVPSLTDKTFTIGEGVFLWGAFVTALITFILTAAAVFFFIVKPAQIVLARMRRKGEEPEGEPSEEVMLLTEIRDALTAKAA